MSTTVSASGLPGRVAIRASTLASPRAGVAVVFVAAVFAIMHPYLGIIADAALYLGRSVADLDPNGVGRDITFVNDGQSRFSVFAHVADPLVATLGVSQASLVIALAASGTMLAALAALARALTSDRRLMVAIALAAIVLPSAYGAGAFRFAEASAVPRPFAEAAVLAAMAALLAGRPLRALPFLLAAVAIHPLMAMAGIGTACVLVAWRRTTRAAIAVALLVGVLAAIAASLAALGVPLLDRLASRVDPEWLAMLTSRSSYLFPGLWDGAAWAAPVVHVTTLAVLALRESCAVRRRVVAAIAISAILQLAAAVVLGDAMHVLLAIQVQGWRALWLLALTASCCLPLVAADLWRAGAQARIALALLGLATLCPLGLPCTIVVCGAALALSVSSLTLPIRDKHATWALASVAAVVAVRAATAAVDWTGLIATEPGGAALGLLAALRADLLVAPAGLLLAVWLLRRPAASQPNAAGLGGLALLTAAAVVGAASTWDQRAAADALFARQDGFTAATVPGTRSSEVMVFGGLSESWFALGRPQYLSAQQASGIVFSRPLAIEWRRRADGLRELGLAARDPLHPNDNVTVTAAKLTAFCRRNDAPAAVVVPDRPDAPAPVVPGAVFWAAAPPHPLLASASPPQWHTIRAWMVAPCASVGTP